MTFALGVLVTAIGLVVVEWARAYVGGHGRSKGANRATVEDIDRVTRKLEAAQAEFSSAASRAVQAHSQLFQLEVSIYRDLWEAYLALEEAASSVWYERISRNGSANAYEEFTRLLQDLHGKIRRHQPFFPMEMRAPLLKAELPVRRLAVELSKIDYSDEVAFRQFLSDRMPAVGEGLHELEAAIRERLWEGDAALAKLLSDGLKSSHTAAPVESAAQNAVGPAKRMRH